MKKLFIILLTLILTVSTYTNVNAENAFEEKNTQEKNVYILKEGLKNRENSITVFCETTENDHMLVIDNIINEALKHTGKSDEGDYIRFHLMSDLTEKVVNKTFEKVYKLEIKFSPRYLSTYDQEQELTEKLNNFYNTLNLNNMSDYEKLKAIYDYICDNVAYGYQNNSAYSALINGSSSCRGYALLFYRMALDLGFDARIIPGRVVGGNYDNYHEWNIVKIGSKWYNVDVNFGDNTGSQMGNQAKYTYFLKGVNGIFKDGYGSYVPAHVRDAFYDTEEFNTNYPMSETDFNKNNFVEGPEEEEEKPEENTTEIIEETTEETTENNNQKPDEDRLSKLNELLNKITIKIKPVKVKLIKFFKVK